MTHAHELLDYLRGEEGTEWEAPLPAASVNLGFAETIGQPSLSVVNFAAKPVYDTAGINHWLVTFSLHTFAKSLLEAEDLMAEYHDRLGLTEGSKVTFENSRGGFIENYGVTIEDDRVYHVFTDVQIVVAG